MQKTYVAFQSVVAAALAWLSAELGILFHVLALLTIMMAVDYLTGMIASKKEAIEHPEDPSKGWNSKKGAIGIFKKVGYLCVIAVAMVVDFVIVKVAVSLGYTEISAKAMFGLLAAVWYLLNELLSIVENAGRMGAPVPQWLAKYIAVLKNKIDDSGTGGQSTEHNGAGGGE